MQDKNIYKMGIRKKWRLEEQRNLEIGCLPVVPMTYNVKSISFVTIENQEVNRSKYIHIMTNCT